MVEVGDRIVVEAQKVGTPPREGVVIGIDRGLMRVRWEGGAESTFVPAAGSLRVVGRGRATSARGATSRSSPTKHGLV